MKPKRPRDPNQLAKRVVDIATGNMPPDAPDRRDANAVAMGKKGGPARAAKLTAARRSEIAKKAARARWKRRPQ